MLTIHPHNNNIYIKKVSHHPPLQKMKVSTHSSCFANSSAFSPYTSAVLRKGLQLMELSLEVALAYICILKSCNGEISCMWKYVIPGCTQLSNPVYPAEVPPPPSLVAITKMLKIVNVSELCIVLLSYARST